MSNNGKMTLPHSSERTGKLNICCFQSVTLHLTITMYDMLESFGLSVGLDALDWFT